MAFLVQSMFVVGVEFENDFLIQNFYELLPLLPIEGFEFKKGKSIPFFGINDTIVSVVPKIKNRNDIFYENRGVRKNNNSNLASNRGFGNSVGIDFQSKNKNFHIKICSSKEKKSKLHITGLTSFEMAQEITESLLHQIKLTENAWMPFFILDYDSKMNLISYIVEMVSDGDKILNFNDNLLQNKLNDSIHFFGEYFECVKLILRYTFEDKTIIDFYNRLHRISNIIIGQNSLFHNEKEFKVVKYDIYNGTYNGNIGYKDLFLVNIATKLLDLSFQACFSNIAKTEIRIMIPIRNNDINSNSNKTNNIKGHLFIIGPRGSLELYSRGNPNEAISIGNYVIETIRQIIESKEYHDSIYENSLI